jgi:hypothetical protein
MKVIDFLYSKIEFPAFGFGAISYLQFAEWFTNWISPLIMALLSGALAAFGAHLVKMIITKNNKNHGKK